MVERWGAARADVVGQRLQELEAVETLAELALFPHLRITAVSSLEVWVIGAEPVRLLLDCSGVGGVKEIVWEEIAEVTVIDVVMDDWKGGD